MTSPHPIPAAALAAHTAVLGKTGSGKTSTAKLAIEQVVAQGARVCILDPIKSDWWGLTSSADGRRAGLPFQILGGPHGHVPLTSSAGAAVAALVASGDLPLSVIDMAQFEPGGLQSFFNALAPTLLEQMRGVLYLVMEEAHLFAPKERSGIGAETHAIHWAKTLATAGRSKGIRLILATQRTQALHNAMLGSCETMITHRLTAPADQTPVKLWLKANVDRDVFTKVESSLAGLPTGTAWLCCGEAGIFEKIAFPRISTFDNTATPTGEIVDRKVKQAPIDVGKLRALIGQKVAEAEANDPAKLKARIAELEAASKSGTAPVRRQSEASAAAARPASAEEITAAEQRGYQRGWTDGVAIGADRGVRVGWNNAVNASRKHAEGFLGQLAPERVAAMTVVAVGEAPTGKSAAMTEKSTAKYSQEYSSPRVSVDTQAVARPNGHAGPDTKLGAERRILAVLAGAHPAGMTEAQWAVAAGMKRSGGTWGTYKSRLRVAGAIEQRDSLWFATADGLAAVGTSVEPMPPPGSGLVEFWIGRISGVGPMLRELAARYPRPMERDSLAGAIGMTASGGTFGTYLSRLSAAGLIEKSAAGVRAAPALMERP